MPINDLAKQSVVSSMREKIKHMDALCSQAESSEMTTVEFLALMADELTGPTVRILATLYVSFKDSKGEESANAVIEGYITHLRENVIGLSAEAEQVVSSLNEAQSAIDKAATSANRH